MATPQSEFHDLFMDRPYLVIGSFDALTGAA